MIFIMKNTKRMLLIFFVVMLFISGCGGNTIEDNIPKEIENIDEIEIEDNNLDEVLSEYIINVDFIPEQKIIQANQNVIYTNNEDEDLQSIFFHIYPNAFKTKETMPFLFDDYIRAYPNGFAEGYINIEELYIDGDKVEYFIKGDANTILEIPLSQNLKQGENISIDMKYEVKIPPATERFGYGKDTYNLGNWYPVIAVYDETGWNLDTYYPLGDPFYTDVSNYRVSINAPKDITIATTGDILVKEQNDDIIKWNIEADLVRDFAWIASAKFEIIEEKIDDIVVKLYFLNDQEIDTEVREVAINSAVDSIRIFNSIFGKYPYNQYSVVQTNFPSGMEYPQIVFIGKDYYRKEYINFLETLIVHETAHQWWYGIVGNDQIEESWLDESLTSYSEVIYFTENYSKKLGRDYHKYENLDRYAEYPDSIKEAPVIKALNEFEGWEDYGLLVYTKGAIFLDDLKMKYGEEMFYNILKTYYNRYKFKIAKTEDFIKISEEIAGDDLGTYFDKGLR